MRHTELPPDDASGHAASGGQPVSRRAPPSRPPLGGPGAQRQDLGARAAVLAPRSAEQTIGARRATAAESRLPAEARGGTLLTMERTVLGDGGRTVEFDSHPYRASGYPFEMTLTAP